MPELTESINMDSHPSESAALFAALCFVYLVTQEFPQGPVVGDLPPLCCCLNNKNIAIGDLKWSFNNVNSSAFRLPQG
jgi:hypothetical protein